MNVLRECLELASNDQIQERMPSDLAEVHKSDLVETGPGDIQVSQMSITEADTDMLNNLLDVELAAGEGLLSLHVI